MKRIILCMSFFITYANFCMIEPLDLNRSSQNHDLEAGSRVPGLDLNQLEEDIASGARAALEAKFGSNEKFISKVLPHLKELYLAKANSANSTDKLHVNDLVQYSSRSPNKISKAITLAPAAAPQAGITAAVAQPQPSLSAVGTKEASLLSTVSGNISTNPQLAATVQSIPASLEGSITQAIENGWSADAKQKYGWMVATGVTIGVSAAGITLSTVLTYYFK